MASPHLDLIQVHLSIFLDWVRLVTSSLHLPLAALSGEPHDSGRPQVLVAQGPILHEPRLLSIPVHYSTKSWSIKATDTVTFTLRTFSRRVKLSA